MSESEKLLFHYTSLEGLLGIIKTKSIWATNILFLNDASEIKYSIKLLKEQIINFQSGVKNALICEYISFFCQTLISIIETENFIPLGRFGYFVCSFSEKEDLLSQWRGYCPKGIGFSLGFKFSNLKKMLQQKGISINRCIYGQKKQKDKLINLIESITNKLTTKFTPSWKEDWNSIGNKLLVDLILKFIKMAPTFKGPAFKEEKEWRIISGPQEKKTSESIKFRSGQSMIVPYIEIPLPRDGDNLIIDRIVVGPTHERNLSKASVELLLKSKDVKFDEVQCSAIPYRNW